MDRLPTISEKDRKDILFALEQNVDFISVSCIRSIEDVEEMRILLGNSKIKVCGLFCLSLCFCVSYQYSPMNAHTYTLACSQDWKSRWVG